MLNVFWLHFYPKNVVSSVILIANEIKLLNYFLPLGVNQTKAALFTKGVQFGLLANIYNLSVIRIRVIFLNVGRSI